MPSLLPGISHLVNVRTTTNNNLVNVIAFIRVQHSHDRSSIFIEFYELDRSPATWKKSKKRKSMVPSWSLKPPIIRKNNALSCQHEMAL